MTWLNAIVGGIFPNALIVAKREYLTRVRNRTFVILTVGLALVGLALAFLPLGLRFLGGDRPTKVAVSVTATNLAFDPVTRLNAILVTSGASNPTGGSGDGGTSGSTSGTTFTVLAVSDAAGARNEVRNDKLDGLLTIARSSGGDLTFDYFTKASPTSQATVLVRQATQIMATSDRAARLGVSEAALAQIGAPVTFNMTSADPNASKLGQDEYIPSYIMATVFIVLIFMAVQLYGNWVAASVAEEKSTRVMELLVTAATPRQLLAGKVLGNGAAGLTQYAVVLGAAVAGFFLQETITQQIYGSTGGTPGVSSLTVPLALGFGAFFVTGFLLYAILYAAAGSMVSRLEDIQQMVGPLTMLGLAGYLLAFFSVNVIDAPWVKIVSLVPFLSTFVFPGRMVLASPAPWEYVVAIGLSLAALVGALWLAARVYAAGVLLYGQRPTLKTVWRVTFGQQHIRR
jgi:ABC-2 type transport system permease protein